MSRSNKKGPYIDKKSNKKVEKQKKAGEERPEIKTYARSSQIPPEFVGHKFAIHNGRKFISVFVTEDMVGHRLGEFAPTRKFTGHGRVTKRILEKT